MSSATWKTFHHDFAVNSCSVSSHKLMFPDLYDQSLVRDSLTKVLTVLIDQSDRVGQPDNIEFQFDQELDEAALQWMEVHEKGHIASQLFALCQVLLWLRASSNGRCMRSSRPSRCHWQSSGGFLGQ
jgi:hypothetical protein